MDKPVNTDSGIADAENSESAPIDSHIEELMTCRKSIEKLNEKKEFRRNQSLKLLRSNYNIEMNHDKLAQKITDMEAKILENITIYTVKKQEVKDFQNARADMSHKQWDNCLSEIGNYANHFSQWITEYRTEILKKDIENYQKECKKVHEELFSLKKELNDMRAKYDLDDYIVANVEDDDLANLNSVISDTKLSNNNLMNTVRLTEDTLNKIQKKIKQSKIAVNEYKMKEKVNKF